MKLKKGWYVLYVQTKHERSVNDALKELQIDAYLPIYTSVRRWSDRTKKVRLPLFPNYVFVYLNSSTDVHRTLNIPGAFSFIKIGQKLSQISEKEIQEIQLTVGDENLTDVQVSSRRPQVGEVHTITNGPLSGLECTIVKANNRNKIFVVIKSIGQKITASIPNWYLERSYALSS